MKTITHYSLALDFVKDKASFRFYFSDKTSTRWTKGVSPEMAHLMLDVLRNESPVGTQEGSSALVTRWEAVGENEFKNLKL